MTFPDIKLLGLFYLSAGIFLYLCVFHQHFGFIDYWQKHYNSTFKKSVIAFNAALYVLL